MNILDMLDELESVIANAKKPLLQGDKVMSSRKRFTVILTRFVQRCPMKFGMLSGLKKRSSVF